MAFAGLVQVYGFGVWEKVLSNSHNNSTFFLKKKPFFLNGFKAAAFAAKQTQLAIIL